MLLAALADPVRLSIVRQLAESDGICACDFTECCDVSQPTISHHLRVLREAGLVAERREGRTTRYRATPGGLSPLVDWIGIYGVFWADRFAALRRLPGLRSAADLRD